MTNIPNGSSFRPDSSTLESSNLEKSKKIERFGKFVERKVTEETEKIQSEINQKIESIGKKLGINHEGQGLSDNKFVQKVARTVSGISGDIRGYDQIKQLKEKFFNAVEVAKTNVTHHLKSGVVQLKNLLKEVYTTEKSYQDSTVQTQVELDKVAKKREDALMENLSGDVTFLNSYLYGQEKSQRTESLKNMYRSVQDEIQKLPQNDKNDLENLLNDPELPNIFMHIKTSDDQSDYQNCLLGIKRVGAVQYYNSKIQPIVEMLSAKKGIPKIQQLQEPFLKEVEQVFNKMSELENLPHQLQNLEEVAGSLAEAYLSKTFDDYCEAFKHSNTIVEQFNRDSLDVKSECKNHPIIFVQRMPRHKMLLEGIKKNSSKIGVSEEVITLLDQAINKVNEQTKKINESF
ncbi:MAG: hypothetical protein H7A37_10210 [Chlamydiales bacterium]|nr:hypothetical protein [Chlamydiia bacterium]MCP5508650.1 hypothetical protein [Chlamydiales bacterium]